MALANRDRGSISWKVVSESKFDYTDLFGALLKVGMPRFLGVE
jgi:hypothetical protein